MNLMLVDKKIVDSHIRLVLPTEASAEIVDDVDEGAIALAWSSVGAT